MADMKQTTTLCTFFSTTIPVSKKSKNFYPHGRDAPVVASTRAGWVKQWQSDERDGGSDSERPDEAHEEANETRETYKHLEQRAHHNGTLELETDTRKDDKILVKNV